MGFPPALYDHRYAAPGAPALAGRVAGLLREAGISCAVDPLRGLDHGAWVPLKLMYPEADVPACQLSVQSPLGPEHHIALGKALAPLRGEGVLILGSGSATHNLADFRFLRRIDEPPRPYVKPFDDWLVTTVAAGDEKALADYRRAPEGARNHPSAEHFLPIFVPFGAALAAGEGRGRTLHRSYTYGILAMTAFAWGMA
jgi:4,5-DOPA dioxygenase extradiol